MGRFLEALDEAGVARDAIGTVALTHTHEDHVNGLVAADGSEAFPKLERLLVPEAELALFDREERLARFRQRRLPLADGARLSRAITSIPAIGHEVGHTAFAVESAGETLLIWGDVVHVPSIQFARPEVAWELDADQEQARATRQAMLERAARPGVLCRGRAPRFSRCRHGFGIRGRLSLHPVVACPGHQLALPECRPDRGGGCGGRDGGLARALSAQRDHLVAGREPAVQSRRKHGARPDLPRAPGSGRRRRGARRLADRLWLLGRPAAAARRGGGAGRGSAGRGRHDAGDRPRPVPAGLRALPPRRRGGDRDTLLSAGARYAARRRRQPAGLPARLRPRTTG